MKFKIREGFSIETVTFTEKKHGRDRVATRHESGAVVHFEAEEAEQHVHKLEPLDGAARAWAEARDARYKIEPIGTQSLV